MGVVQHIEIDGRQVPFKASAAIPRIYRIKFHRDIFRDLKQLDSAIKKEDEEDSGLDLVSLEMFENIAFLMARHADPAHVPETTEDWLDQFQTFSIYQVLPEIVRLWGLNLQTQVDSKKKFDQLTAK